MANKGRRMVFEEDIKKIGQGGSGATYTAGDNISISADNVISATDTTYTAGYGIIIGDNNAVSVDTVAIPTNLDVATAISNSANAVMNEVNARTPLQISYPVNPKDVYDALYAEDPTITEQQAITKWLKDMPVLVGRGEGVKSALETAGYTNVIEMLVGQEIKCTGFFGLAAEGTSSPYAFANKVYIFANAGSSASVNLWNNAAAKTTSFNGLKNGNQQYQFEHTRFRYENTSLSSYVDPFNNQVQVQGLTSNFASTVVIAAKDGIPYGREIEGAIINTNAGYTPYNLNIANGMTLPTTEGTYTLKVTIDNTGAPTVAWVADVTQSNNE